MLLTQIKGKVARTGTGPGREDGGWHNQFRGALVSGFSLEWCLARSAAGPCEW
uniref:Uncharacterized protein n=1 Tax=Arundo donax TaxID=35708 RepID=A0A0A8Z802_ARUDO